MPNLLAHAKKHRNQIGDPIADVARAYFRRIRQWFFEAGTGVSDAEPKQRDQDNATPPERFTFHWDIRLR